MSSSSAVLSVITPTLNCMPYIGATVRSLHESGIPHRHIAVDGGSKDGTQEVLRAGGASVYDQRSAKKSMYAAINEGMERADSPWVTYLNGDDLTLPGAYTRLVRAGEAAGADVVYADGCAFRMTNGRIRLELRAAMRDAAPLLLAGGLPFYQPAAVFRRELWSRLGGFNADMRHVGDWDFFARALLGGARLRYEGGFLACAFRRTGTSLFDREVAVALRERDEGLARLHAPKARVALGVQRAIRPLRTLSLCRPHLLAKVKREIASFHEE